MPGRATPQRTWESDATVLYYFRDFQRMTLTPRPWVSCISIYAPVMVRQVRIAVNPPHPNMRIKENHCTASQSAWATGSVGSRNGRAPHATDTAGGPPPSGGCTKMITSTSRPHGVADCSG